MHATRLVDRYNYLIVVSSYHFVLLLPITIRLALLNVSCSPIQDSMIQFCSVGHYVTPVPLSYAPSFPEQVSIWLLIYIYTIIILFYWIGVLALRFVCVSEKLRTFLRGSPTIGFPVINLIAFCIFTTYLHFPFPMHTVRFTYAACISTPLGFHYPAHYYALSYYLLQSLLRFSPPTTTFTCSIIPTGLVLYT